jgi:hypothetical protein
MMQTIHLDFSLILGQPLESIPEPELLPGVELPPPPPAPPAGESHPIQKIAQQIDLIQNDNGGWSGIYTHPIWGSVPAQEVSVSDNHIAFSAPSGNNDKGGRPALFHFAFVRVDSTNHVVGFSGGQAPYFRSFLPVEGTFTLSDR